MLSATNEWLHSNMQQQITLYHESGQKYKSLLEIQLCKLHWNTFHLKLWFKKSFRAFKGKFCIVCNTCGFSVTNIAIQELFAKGILYYRAWVVEQRKIYPKTCLFGASGSAILSRPSRLVIWCFSNVIWMQHVRCVKVGSGVGDWFTYF